MNTIGFGISSFTAYTGRGRVAFGGKIADLNKQRADEQAEIERKQRAAEALIRQRAAEAEHLAQLPGTLELLGSTVLTAGKDAVSGWDLVDELMSIRDAPSWKEYYDKPFLNAEEKGKIFAFFEKLGKLKFLRHRSEVSSTNSDGYDSYNEWYELEKVGRYEFDKRTRSVEDRESYVKDKGYKHLVYTGNGCEWKFRSELSEKK